MYKKELVKHVYLIDFNWYSFTREIENSGKSKDDWIECIARFQKQIQAPYVSGLAFRKLKLPVVPFVFLKRQTDVFPLYIFNRIF